MTIQSILHRLHQVPYLLGGLTRRFTVAQCPSCGNRFGQEVARKLFHTLLECPCCALLYRYPAESRTEMQEFYDDGYVEPGITTELPDDATLAQLVASEFKGSAKDFSYHIAMLRALGVQPSARLLDFGANWGYASWQFMRAGWEVQSFEISRPRAAYGRKLGLNLVTSLAEVSPPFDVVFSCHVLEHVPNPRETLEQMLRLVRPGGLVVGLTPNGSKSFRTSRREDFQQLWGQVHPVLLTDVFVQRLAVGHLCLVISDDAPACLATWDQTTSEVRDCSGPSLFFAIRS